MIAVTCPNCDARLKTADDKLGKTLKCPKCGAGVKVARTASGRAAPQSLDFVPDETPPPAGSNADRKTLLAVAAILFAAALAAGAFFGADDLGRKIARLNAAPATAGAVPVRETANDEPAEARHDEIPVGQRNLDDERVPVSSGWDLLANHIERIRQPLPKTATDWEALLATSLKTQPKRSIDELGRTSLTYSPDANRAEGTNSLAVIKSRGTAVEHVAVVYPWFHAAEGTIDKRNVAPSVLAAIVTTMAGVDSAEYVRTLEEAQAAENGEAVSFGSGRRCYVIVNSLDNAELISVVVNNEFNVDEGVFTGRVQSLLKEGGRSEWNAALPEERFSAALLATFNLHAKEVARTKLPALAERYRWAVTSFWQELSEDGSSVAEVMALHSVVDAPLWIEELTAKTAE